MFQKPKSAKRLYFDVIPRAVDDYLQLIAAYPGQSAREQLDNPVWHIHGGEPPEAGLPVTFALLLNLVSASNAHDKEVLWGFIRRHSPDASPAAYPLLDHLVGYAVRYYDDFVKPTKTFRAPTQAERKALAALSAALAQAKPGSNAEELQTIVYETGKANGFADDLRAWFKAIYEVLLGQSQGPRFGGFIELYGIAETRALIDKALRGELIKAA
jgi:lysyl-tRNA synthetase class 1